jgi:hypothetical protein
MHFEKVRNEKKMFYKGGKENGPNGQTQGALTGTASLRDGIGLASIAKLYKFRKTLRACRP